MNTKSRTKPISSPKLSSIVVIGKFDDGKCRQIVFESKTRDVILSSIIACQRKIRVLDTVIEGLDIN